MVKPLPKKSTKDSVVNIAETAGELQLPPDLKKELFKAIKKVNQGSMRAEELSALTQAIRTYYDLDARGL